MRQPNELSRHHWPRCPDAAEYFTALFRAFEAMNSRIGRLQRQFISDAGVSLTDLIDHWVVPETESLEYDLEQIGLVRISAPDGESYWIHPLGRFPAVRVGSGDTPVRMAIRVEDIRLFCECHDLPYNGQHGDPNSGYEEARFSLGEGELAIVVRQGNSGYQPGRITASEERSLSRVRHLLSTRSRIGPANSVIDAARAMLSSMMEDVHRDRLVDEFFLAERNYYLGRNRAAKWQYDRQQEVGIGWANHDHHTYRSSRPAFRALINLWLELGFVAREKFYAGSDAGWGAQVLDHPVSRVVLFCDVDMSPEEIGVDFQETALLDQQSLGTIGLWASLHGDSIGQAGLHHLEAEFDYASIREQLIKADYPVMMPFTDLPMLKQAFTAPEMWQVALNRISVLLENARITAEQANQFQQHGAPGSHLEILQRWEGYRGFNQAGISAIIRQTDARLLPPVT